MHDFKNMHEATKEIWRLDARVRELETALRFYTEKHPGGIIGGYRVPCDCVHCGLLAESRTGTGLVPGDRT